MRGAGRVNKRKVAWSYLDLQTNSIKEVSYRFPCTACTRHFLNHATIGFSIEGVSNCQLNKKIQKNLKSGRLKTWPRRKIFSLFLIELLHEETYMGQSIQGWTM